MHAAVRLSPQLPSTPANRILRGLGSNVLSLAISGASSILLVPLFLHAWGAPLYGRWITLTALVSYLTLLDLGGQSFFQNLLAAEYARGNDEEFRRKFSEGVSLFCLISALAFALLVGLVCIPEIHLFHRTLAMTVGDRIVVLFVGVPFLLWIPMAIYACAYRATGQFVRGATIGNIYRATSLILYAALLVARVRPSIYATAYLVLGIVIVVVVYNDSRRYIPAIRGSKFGISAAKAGLVHLRGSLYFWLLAISNALNQQGVVLVLALSGSTAAVALYATHRTVCGVIGYVGSLAQSPLWPELTFLFTKGKLDQLARTVLLAVRVVTILSACAAVALWALLPAIYPKWTGRSLGFNPLLLVILLTQAVLASGWTTLGWPLLASNHHRRLSCWALGNGALTIVLSVMFVSRWGVHGVAFATLIGDIVCGAAVYPFLLARMLSIPVTTLYQTILAPLIVLLPAWIMAIFHPMRALQPLHALLFAAVSIALIYPAVRWAFRDRNDAVWVWNTLRAAIKARG